jgi:hypothetical protein
VTAVRVLLLLLLRYPPTNAHVSLQSYSQLYWGFFVFGFLHLFVPPVKVGLFAMAQFCLSLEVMSSNEKKIMHRPTSQQQQLLSRHCI